MDIEDDFPTIRFEDVVAEIEAHDASHLISCDQNAANGFVTFTFRGEDGEVKGKMTFDELTEDMSYRAKAVLDHLSTTTNFVIDQIEVQNAWDKADPEAAQSHKVR